MSKTANPRRATGPARNHPRRSGMTVLSEQCDVIRQAAGMELAGTVTDVKGLAVRVADLAAPIGASVRVRPARGGEATEGEVVGFDAERTIVMPMGVTAGIRRGDRVVAGQFRPMVRVSEHLQGRVLSGAGEPMDGMGPVAEAVLRPLRPAPVDPLKRPPIKQALAVGVRAIDAMTTAGRGQRLGVFASPGLGKSTLLGMMARHTEADVSVIALVGERGREVRQFIEKHLGAEGRARSVVVCATERRVGGAAGAGGDGGAYGGGVFPRPRAKRAADHGFADALLPGAAAGGAGGGRAAGDEGVSAERVRDAAGAAGALRGDGGGVDHRSFCRADGVGRDGGPGGGRRPRRAGWARAACGAYGAGRALAGDRRVWGRSAAWPTT